VGGSQEAVSSGGHLHVNCFEDLLGSDEAKSIGRSVNQGQTESVAFRTMGIRPFPRLGNINEFVIKGE